MESTAHRACRKSWQAKSRFVLSALSAGARSFLTPDAKFFITFPLFLRPHPQREPEGSKTHVCGYPVYIVAAVRRHIVGSPFPPDAAPGVCDPTRDDMTT
jgi:hypothetical protein